MDPQTASRSIPFKDTEKIGQRKRENTFSSLTIHQLFHSPVFISLHTIHSVYCSYFNCYTLFIVVYCSYFSCYTLFIVVDCSYFNCYTLFIVVIVVTLVVTLFILVYCRYFNCYTLFILLLL